MSLPYLGDIAGYNTDPTIRAAIVPLMRSIYHESDKTAVHDDPRERQRLVLTKTLLRAFSVPSLDRSVWQYKAVLKLFKREEKTDFGRRKTAFSGVISRDTSQGRTTRTDFTANCEMREASAAAKPSTGVLAPADVLSSSGGGGGPAGGTMAQRIAAKRKGMMSWEDFREANLGELPGGTEKAMIEYRMLLDRNREERLAKGRNHKGMKSSSSGSTQESHQDRKRRRKAKKKLKKKEKAKKKKAKKKAKKKDKAKKKKAKKKAKKKKKKKKRNSKEKDDADSDESDNSDDSEVSDQEEGGDIDAINARKRGAPDGSPEGGERGGKRSKTDEEGVYGSSSSSSSSSSSAVAKTKKDKKKKKKKKAKESSDDNSSSSSDDSSDSSSSSSSDSDDSSDDEDGESRKGKKVSTFSLANFFKNDQGDGTKSSF